MAIRNLNNAWLIRLLLNNSNIVQKNITMANSIDMLDRNYTTVSSSDKGQSISISNLNELHPPNKPKLDLSFEDSKTAFKAKSNMELLRGYLVFQLCSFNYLVENNMKLMNLSRRILGEKLFSSFMKMTFYGHFVGGEDQSRIKGNVEKMRKFGVNCILQYSVEEDLTKDHKKNDQMKSMSNTQVKYYDPAEIQYEQNKIKFLECVNAVSDVTQSTGIGAVKLTSLIRPALLLKLSTLCELVSKNENISKDIFAWKNLLTKSEEEFARTFNQMHGLDVQFTPNELGELQNLCRRIDEIMQRAVDKNVGIFVDAEQTYFQSAIHRFTLEAMRHFNKNKCVIMNTYQNYLKSSSDTLNKHLELASKENFYFGAKLVRGAYMEQERKRAKDMSYEDPINENFDATTKMYYKNFIHCLEEIKKRPMGRITIMVASHNEPTVKYAVEKMEEYNIKPSDRVICFGQLLGMCDYISFYLGGVGYPVYKCVQYGPVEEVLPYLSRRANENRGIFDKVKKEKRLIVNELKRRMFSFS